MKQKHSSHPSSSWSSLESSLKASINIKKLQISEVLPIQASKALKNFHYKYLKINIHLNHSYKSQRLLKSSFKASINFKDFDPSKFHWIQALKPQRTFTTNLRRSRAFKELTNFCTYMCVCVCVFFLMYFWWTNISAEFCSCCYIVLVEFICDFRVMLFFICFVFSWYSITFEVKDLIDYGHGLFLYTFVSRSYYVTTFVFFLSHLYFQIILC